MNRPIPPEALDPEWIKAQRAAGWPDMHPEDYCHRCGAPNPNWWTDRETWITATAAWAAETGREGICCPRCLILMHEAAVGGASQWKLTRVIPPAVTTPCTDCTSPAEVTDCRADTGDRCGPCHVARCAECQDGLADQDGAEAARDGRHT